MKAFRCKVRRESINPTILRAYRAHATAPTAIAPQQAATKSVDRTNERASLLAFCIDMQPPDALACFRESRAL
jgi:hypothetical protein